MTPLVRRLLLGATLLATALPLATPVLAQDHDRRHQNQNFREQERRRVQERQRNWERHRYDNYYRRPDVYYSAPPVVYPPPVYYQRPGPELNFTFPFIYR